jgi:hypothetical protein
MNLEAAAKIGARRSGANQALVDIRRLAALAERAAKALNLVTGVPEPTLRSAIRLSLIASRDASHYETPLSEEWWFDLFWFDVKYGVLRGAPIWACRMNVIEGGARPRRRRRRTAKLLLLQGGAA